MKARHLSAGTLPSNGMRLDLKVSLSQTWQVITFARSRFRKSGGCTTLDEGGAMRNLLHVVLRFANGWGWQTYLPSGNSVVASSIFFGTRAEAERDAREFLGMTS